MNKIKFERNKTSSFIVLYSLYLYFLGLSLGNASKALIIFKDEKRSHVSVWNWIQSALLNTCKSLFCYPFYYPTDYLLVARGLSSMRRSCLLNGECVSCCICEPSIEL